jgi:hypothetical protein
MADVVVDDQVVVVGTLPVVAWAATITAGMRFVKSASSQLILSAFPHLLRAPSGLVPHVTSGAETCFHFLPLRRRLRC